MPKQLALQKADAIANFSVGPISLLARISSPILKFLTISINGILRLMGIDPDAENNEATEEDIRLLVDIGGDSGTINQSEKLMIENVFEFNDRIVSDITTHRTEMSALSIDLSFAEIIEIIDKYRYTRFPVYEETVDNIVGTLHVKDLFTYINQGNTDAFDFKKILREPHFALGLQTIDVLFATMRKEHSHIAIVLDEFGGTEGLVTIEDVIEEIVGEIPSESIEPGYLKEEISQVSDNEYIMKGTYRLWELENIIQAGLPIDDYDTVSGFLISQMGHVNFEDDSTYTYKNLVFKVNKFEGNKIKTVTVKIENK